MQIWVTTLRHNEALRGFPEDKIILAALGLDALRCCNGFCLVGIASEQVGDFSCEALRVCGDEHANTGRPLVLVTVAPEAFKRRIGL